ncbi:hypothetical protein HPB48_005482 [Haemaphysalis longicornis]|uniref:AB hydrolase-1 domain-containing protein n=1 Tax=Haemaphysalis longicornis TaxID=44386 RepID=A0A9J6H455_HAELO|nr:hypothetical protein HPB48_005482 [Haemaphysalis longicornis]
MTSQAAERTTQEIGEGRTSEAPVSEPQASPATLPGGGDLAATSKSVVKRASGEPRFPLCRLPFPLLPLGLGHRRILVVVLLFGTFLLFFFGIFTGSPEEKKTTGVVPKSSRDPPSAADVQSSWRSFNYKKLEVPHDISTTANQVTPTTGTITVDGLTVFYREVNPEGACPELSVLMLHGAAFKSETWFNLGTLGALGLMGYRVVAIDMPGQLPVALRRHFSPRCPSHIHDRAEFVRHLLAEFKLQKPVIVSPSISGQLSLPFMDQALARDVRLRPSRPHVYPPLQVHLPKEVPNLSCIKVPTMVVFGEHDRGRSSALLNLLPNSAAVEVPHGRHPAYLDNPNLWHQMLYNFLLRLRHNTQQQP